MASPNLSSQFSGDVLEYLADEVLPLAQRRLVMYQFGNELTFPEERGTTYTATRYNRVPLPTGPISEGARPVGQTMSITQITGQLLQWGDLIEMSDVATMTIYHPVFQQAKKLLALQQAETYERNTFNALMGLTQVNYVNQRGSRAALVAGDVMDTHTINRTAVLLDQIGAPSFMGPKETDIKADAGEGGKTASNDPRSMPHYVAVISSLVAGDISENSNFVLAATYSDINRLYNMEIGEWRGIRFCKSNMVPFWTGFAQVTGTAGTAGSLATGSYFVLVTGQDTQNQYESYIAAVSGSISVTGPNGSISVTVPNVQGYTFNVYIGTTASPTNLGLSAAGPTVGPYAGNATQIPPNTTAIITGTGVTQVPPASPAVGVTAYPTFVFGEGAYGQAVMKNPEFMYLTGPDKSDPLNQLRYVGWKSFYGTVITNTQFAVRIESTTAFTATPG